ncbi:hypothetical protein [Clostridium butyricum]|uniref:Replication protein n=1 Tax=Clostridium butyricum TaxID=1492 RepID=A0A6N3FFW2_CLOBU
MENSNFIMLRNEIIRSKLEKVDDRTKKRTKDSLCVRYNNNKLIGVLCALDQSITRNGLCKFTIEELCTVCGVKAIRGYNKDKETGEIIPKSIEQIKLILKLLIDDGYISNINVDLEKVKTTEMISCTYFNKIDDDYKDGFFKLNIDIYNKLLSLKNVDAMVLYCNVKSRIGENNYYCYTALDTFNVDTNIANNTIEKCFKLLKENGLLFTANIGQVRKNRETSNYVTYYVLKEKNVYSALEQAIEDAKSYGFHVLTKFQDSKIKQLNGYKGQKQKQLNAGKIVSKELENKIAELEEKYSYNCEYSKKDLLKLGDKLLHELGLDEQGIDLGMIAKEYDLSVYKYEDLDEIIAILEEMKDKQSKDKHKGIKCTPVSERNMDNLAEVSKEDMWEAIENDANKVRLQNNNEDDWGICAEDMDFESETNIKVVKMKPRKEYDVQDKQERLRKLNELEKKEAEYIRLKKVDEEFEKFIDSL